MLGKIFGGAIAITGGVFTFLTATYPTVLPKTISSLFGVSDELVVLYGLLLIGIIWSGVGIAIFAIYFIRKEALQIGGQPKNNDDLREHNKRLIEESIAKLTFVPHAKNDEDIIVIQPKQTIGEHVINGTGLRPHYHEQMVSHLKQYPDLWKVIRETPLLWKRTKDADEKLTSRLAQAIGKVIVNNEIIDFSHLLELPKILAGRIRRDLMNDYPVEYSPTQAGDKVRIGGEDLHISSNQAKILADEMTRLVDDPEYREKFAEIKHGYSEVNRLNEEFKSERDKLVEKVRLVNYARMEGMCDECKLLKG